MMTGGTNTDWRRELRRPVLPLLLRIARSYAVSWEQACLIYVRMRAMTNEPAAKGER